MDTSVPLYELICLFCADIFYVCPSDYQGHGYCGDACRKAAGAANHRASVARYERSLGEDGRRDRREKQRARRAHKRAEERAVPDV